MTTRGSSPPVFLRYRAGGRRGVDHGDRARLHRVCSRSGPCCPADETAGVVIAGQAGRGRWRAASADERDQCVEDPERFVGSRRRSQARASLNSIGPIRRAHEGGQNRRRSRARDPGPGPTRGCRCRRRPPLPVELVGLRAVRRGKGRSGHLDLGRGGASTDWPLRASSVQPLARRPCGPRRPEESAAAGPRAAGLRRAPARSRAAAPRCSVRTSPVTSSVFVVRPSSQSRCRSWGSAGESAPAVWRGRDQRQQPRGQGVERAGVTHTALPGCAARGARCHGSSGRSACRRAAGRRDPARSRLVRLLAPFGAGLLEELFQTGPALQRPRRSRSAVAV